MHGDFYKSQTHTIKQFLETWEALQALASSQLNEPLKQSRELAASRSTREQPPGAGAAQNEDLGKLQLEGPLPRSALSKLFVASVLQG